MQRCSYKPLLLLGPCRQQETCTIQSIAKILDARIPSPAYEQILVRQDQSATVLVHESEIWNLLRTSGQEAVFLKLHGSSPLLQEADILWLPVEYSLDDALQLSQKDDSSLGVVKKQIRSTICHTFWQPRCP